MSLRLPLPVVSLSLLPVSQSFQMTDSSVCAVCPLKHDFTSQFGVFNIQKVYSITIDLFSFKAADASALHRSMKTTCLLTTVDTTVN